MQQQKQIRFTAGRTVRLAAVIAAFAIMSGVALAQTTFSNLDQKTGWQSCTTCAGAGGSGPSASYSTSAGISSPSMDGASRKFSIGGSTRYANALWWKQLGGNAGASHFTYDLYFYTKTPSAPQALEFDVNQSRSGKKFIFGTECDYNGSHTWKVYDPYNHVWRSTSVACTRPKAYTWNHLVLEFNRTSTGKTGFLTVTINGTKHYFNRSYSPKSSGVSEINVAFQMDLNGSATDYSVYLDKVKLTYW
jgi:hypothetical protein